MTFTFCLHRQNAAFHENFMKFLFTNPPGFWYDKCRNQMEPAPSVPAAALRYERFHKGGHHEKHPTNHEGCRAGSGRRAGDGLQGIQRDSRRGKLPHEGGGRRAQARLPGQPICTRPARQQNLYRRPDPARRGPPLLFRAGAAHLHRAAPAGPPDAVICYRFPPRCGTAVRADGAPEPGGRHHRTDL